MEFQFLFARMNEGTAEINLTFCYADEVMNHLNNTNAEILVLPYYSINEYYNTLNTNYIRI